MYMFISFSQTNASPSVSIRFLWELYLTWIFMLVLHLRIRLKQWRLMMESDHKNKWWMTEEFLLMIGTLETLRTSLILLCNVWKQNEDVGTRIKTLLMIGNSEISSIVSFNSKSMSSSTGFFQIRSYRSVLLSILRISVWNIMSNKVKVDLDIRVLSWSKRTTWSMFSLM